MHSDPSHPLMMTSAESDQVLRGFNDTASGHSLERLVHELFEEQVLRTPDVVAVMHEGRSLTYAELNGKANQLARYLRERAVGPDRLVGICVERDLEMVVGLLGILKAGGAYVPLDPHYPIERLRYMLADAGPQVMLSESQLPAGLEAEASIEVIALQRKLQEIAGHDEENLEPAELGLTAQDAVYVIYTSGSSGRPKATVMSHRSMVNLIEWHRESLGASEGQRVLQFAALSFDVAFQETFSTLCTGGTLLLLNESVRRDVRALAELLCSHNVDRLFVPPLMLEILAEHAETSQKWPSALKDVITAGEQLRIPAKVSRFFERLGDARLHNHYGPTETHVVTALTLAGKPQDWPELPPIGRPISNNRVYILDEHMELVPIGVAGEIYIAGAGVARGYLNRPELTAERFLRDPFSSDPQARMYKTGDLGRWRADGNIEFLGRNDDQVKIRGYRIELGEIEAQLTRHPQVKDAVVLAREDIPGEKRLVAYITPTDQGEPSVEGLRGHLKALLPEYMIPAAFVRLERLPLTPNGKLDRRALPAPGLEAYASREYELPQGEVEEILARIWQELLRVERVGRQDNFFELGGHSLLMVQLMERLRRVGWRVDAHAVYATTTLAAVARELTDSTVDAFEVPPNRIPLGCETIDREMLSLVNLEAEHIEQIVRAVPGGASNIQDIYPLAPLQQGLLFHYLLNAHGGDTYVLPILFLLSSQENVQQLVDALQFMIDRHDVLRTAVLWEQLPGPVQVVYRRAGVTVEDLVLSGSRDCLSELKELMRPDRLRLDVRRAPLMRLQVVRDPDGDSWYALLQLHHLTCDHESLERLLAELMACLEGRGKDLPEPGPYRNYVAQALAHARTQDADEFFRRKLGTFYEPNAPFGLVDVRGDGSQLEEAHEELDPSLGRRIRVQARRSRVSPATLFHVGWGLVVAHTSGCDEAVFGTLLLGRLQYGADAQRCFGMSINTLPFRVRMQDVNVSDLVIQTQRELAELLRYEQTSLAVAQRCSGVAGSTPLFATLLNYLHGTPTPLTGDRFAAPGVRILGIQEWTNYPISLSVTDQGDAFWLTAQTDRSIAPRRILAYISCVLRSLVDALESYPGRQALSLSILPELEREEVIDHFNRTRAKFPHEKTIHELFEEQVVRTPDARAVIYEGQSLTYAELNDRANQLAHYLREQGVQPEEYVPILMPRCLWMLVAQLAVLKSGGVYVPVDPRTPIDRQAFMIRDCNARRVLTESGTHEWLNQGGVQCIECARVADLLGHRSTDDLKMQGQASSPVYVMYTSGSTGVPKGVVVPHRAVSRLVINNGYAQIVPTDCIAHCSNPAFDASTFEIWGALLNGATLLIVPEADILETQRFAQVLKGHRVTILFQTTALFNQHASLAPDTLAGLRYLLFGGELSDPEIVRKLLTDVPIQHLLHVYGPTETTTFATWYPVVSVEIGARILPIGKPISNTRIYILDKRLQPVPIGVAGEIYIGGAGVALGYLNRPELTAERFLRDPFSSDPQARMYKTGDLGRWRADGNIEFLGRNDDQVKIRGYRIELGEIEAQLARHQQVKDAVVLAREDVPGERRLVAYITLSDQDEPSVEGLRAYLKALLPEYMVPGAFVTLEKLPLTPNGKVDRRGLPAPELEAYASREYELPQGEVEEMLAGTWQELLRVGRVGRRDHFFELGGHSLLMVQLMERLRQVGLSIDIWGIIESPVLADMASTLKRRVSVQIDVPPNRIPPGCEVIVSEMLSLVELEAEHIGEIVRAVPGGAKNIQDIYPLTPLQQGLLFHHVMGEEQGGDTYLVSTLLSVPSRERVQALIAAYQHVIERHDILRTAVLWENLPHPVQVVYRQASLPVQEITLDGQRDPIEQLKDRMSSDQQWLDLRSAPLLRLQIAADPHSRQWYAMLQVHHIVEDGESVKLLMAEVTAYLGGRGHLLPMPVAYRDHVARALLYAARHEWEEFFHSQLGDIEETTAPFGLVDVHGAGRRIDEAQEQLDHAFGQRLRAAARRLGVTVAAVVHVAWAQVVARTSSRADVVFGTVLLGRLQGSTGGQPILGLLINTLPLRVSLHFPARDLVLRTQRALMELVCHEQASLAEALRCSGIVGSVPLFTAVLNYRHSTKDLEDDLRHSEIRIMADHQRTNYPITLSVDDFGDALTLTAQTDRRIPPQRILRYMSTALRSLVQALESAPRTPALSLSVLPEQERRQLIEGFNQNELDGKYPEGTLVHELFEEQVLRTPDVVAVMHEGRSLTYAELNGKANQLARYLRKRGVSPDRLVGICVERGLEMVVGLLGILKAGGAYVPLDPHYPIERLQYMLADAGPQVVLSEPQLPVGLEAEASIEVIALQRKLQEIAGHDEENLEPAERGLTAQDAVYVIYTSGSSGRPKATVMSHRSMVNLIEWHRDSLSAGEGQRVLQFAALSFDVAFQETFSTLCTGGTLLLLNESVRRDVRALAELLSSQMIERLFVPPLMLEILAEHAETSQKWPSALKDVITAGEQLRIPAKVSRFFERLGDARLHNHYGPTETHVVTALTLTGKPQDWPELPPIGRPISNNRVYILDEHMELVPIGVVGEIYIAGAGVARGYLNRPELTAERFLRDPFSSDPQARMYKTGDLGRWRVDGNIEFLGRNDDQVKIRGYRIELGEIEAQLTRHPQVKDAVVLAREDMPGEKRLVAYITPADQGEPNVEGLRGHLKALLPEYMIPAAFVRLERLPLTPNGKLDRRGLPAPELEAYASREYELPQGEVEEILAGIWQELLRVERVGRQDNFFELGGHSLLMVQLMERLRRVGLSIEVRGVFENPVLADLANALIRGETSQIDVSPSKIPLGCETIDREMLSLDNLEAEHIEQIVRAVPGGASNIQDIYPLTPLQQGLLFHHVLGDQQGGDTYVVSTLLALHSLERMQALIAAYQHVIERHDILRTAVLWENLPHPVQVVYRRASLPVHEIALDGGRDPVEELKERMSQERRRLDLRQAPLMQLQVARDVEGTRWFALVHMHHLVCDHESLETMFAEVMACLEGRARDLPEPVAYRVHVAQALAHAARHDSLGFFRSKLGDVQEPTAPFGLLDVYGDGSQIDEAREEVEPSLAKRIRSLARVLRVSTATLFHAAWALVVGHTSGRDDVVFGTVLLGRLHGSAGAQRILGIFINTLPLRLSLNVTARVLVEQTQRALVELLNHEQASLAEAQRCSGIVGSAPLFSALFNYRHSASDLEDQWHAREVQFIAGSDRTSYPITLSVDDLGEQFVLEAQTDRRIDPRRILGYMSTTLRSLVNTLETKPDTLVLRLSILPGHEWQQVVEGFNQTRAEHSYIKLLHELFEDQVARTPDATAVVCEAATLTYGQLNAAANRLGHFLRSYGVGPDIRVGICLERGIEMVVGMLAVLKAGGAYVPLDPTYPSERLRYQIEDSTPLLLLSDVVGRRALKGVLEDVGSGLAILDLQGDASLWAQHSQQNLSAAAVGLCPRHLAYVTYTSGSTGQPKGVMIEHSCVVNFWAALEQAVYRCCRDIYRVSVNAPITFDASVQQIVQLLSGRCLVVIPQSVRTDSKALLSYLAAHRVNALDCTPTQLDMLIASGMLDNEHALALVLVGGEAIDRTLWSTLARSAQVKFYNVYGPTECTVDSTIAVITEAEANPDIGRPIANVRVYILDTHMRPVPVGVVGEIHVAGAGVARGYLNRPELTAERFLRDPFSRDPLARMYKTGDLGRWRADGNIEFLGRNDDQVKIRGYRIELGEIEAQLARHPQVNDAVVLAREDVIGEKRLVAYITPTHQGAPSVEGLRAHLRGVLPEYMLPSAFVKLERLPLTSNGKLDRRALPAPQLEAYANRGYEAPQGEVEGILAGTWQELLAVKPVGRWDHFFELGGHSLLIVRMKELLRRMGLSIEVRWVFESPVLADLASALKRGASAQIEVPPNGIPPRCEAIVPEMLPLVNLEAQHIEQIAQAVPGGVSNIQDVYPLAPLQEGLLFHHRLKEQGGDTYVVSSLLSVPSRERLDTLIAAFQQVIDRHDILRTAVLWEHLPRPVQVVYRQAKLPVQEITLDGGGDPVEELKEWMTSERRRLDLRQAPVMQLQVARDVEGTCWYALLHMHHLVCDHESLEVMFAELLACVECRVQDLAQPVAYRNHVAQALVYAAREDWRDFFRGNLGDVQEPTAPFGLSDVHGDGSQIDEAREDVDPGLARRMRSLARRLGVTAATLFHVVWALVVGHTSGRDDPVFGTVLLGRSHGSACGQPSLGMFINTLPVRLWLTVPIGELVDQAQRALVQLLNHEQASLADVQRCSAIVGSTPLFSALLNYRHSASDLEDQWRARGIQFIDGKDRTSYPITLSVDDLGTAFRLTVQTDRRVDPRRVLGYTCAALGSLVEVLEKAPQTLALTLCILPACERQLVVDGFNQTQAQYAHTELVHKLFEDQVDRTPDAVAVTFAGQSLTYRELNGKANQLARHLRERGVSPDQTVGLCVNRSLDMLVGLLGILKAGGTYVPLDPGYPIERLRYMIKDARPRVVLIEPELLTVLRGTPASALTLDDAFRAVADYPQDNLPTPVPDLTSQNLVYVIYTSGTAGAPKGTAMTHRSMVNLIEWHRDSFGASEGRRVLQFAALSFDVAFQETFSTLCTGGTLLLLNESVRRDVRALAELLCSQMIERLFVPPLMLEILAEHAETSQKWPFALKDVITAGEELRIPAKVSRFFERLGGARLHNHYGPTETHVVTALTLAGKPQDWPELPPIGRPIANNRVYILDKHMQLVPIGVAGEIYIAGAGVARGYLNRPELTAERFLRDPFRSDPQARMYKTGDLGRWRADGNIEFLGRNDDQVKIRGYRIEPHEIEVQLELHEQVSKAVVIACEDAQGARRLVAYVIPVDGRRPSGPTPEALRDYLSGIFPEFMVPSAYVILECLPLSPSGKLDRRALPAPDLHAYVSGEYEAPQGEVEEAVTEIWRKLLRVERIGRRDNFFDLGGHSLLATRVIAHISHEFDVELPLRAIFEASTVEALSQRIVKQIAGDLSTGAS